MKKKPLSIYGLSENARNKLPLAFVTLTLFALSLICLVTSAVVYWSDNSGLAGDWLLTFLLVNGVISVSAGSVKKVHDKRSKHWRGSAISAALTGLLAALLYPSNPWFVCASLAACPLLMVYVRSRFCLVYGPYPEQLEFNEFVGVFFCAIFAGAVWAIMAYVPLFTASLIIAVLYGVVVYAYYGLLWYTRREEMPLSHDQHVDVWPHRFETLQVAPSVWAEMQSYVLLHGAFPEKALRELLEKLDLPTLLAYFDAPRAYDPKMSEFAQAVELRICLLDSYAAAVFNMHGDKKADAVEYLKDTQANPNKKAEAYDLPDMEVQA